MEKNELRIRLGDKVKISYTAKLEDGTLFDKATVAEPLELIVGEENTLIGLEETLIGLKKGDKKKITITADKAYGPKLKDLVVEIEKDKLPVDIELKEGQEINISQDETGIIKVKISKITDEKVIFDANHPLAGKNLVFDIQVLEVVR